MAVQTTSWVGQPRIKGSSESMRMFLLTFSLIGLQFAWGTEMTYCTPYLLSLGLSKSKLSLVWVAGPLSGLVMQPIIGQLSDKSTSKYGRRRPYMVGGSAAVAACYFILGWAKEIAAYFVEDPELRSQYAIALVIFDIYVLDFLINMAQTGCRALVLDTLPVSKQQLGAAWCSRMTGFGHLLVYAVGALDLNSLLGNVLGDTQFKKVCVIAGLAMVFAQGVSCWAVQERALVSDGEVNGKNQSIVSVLSQIYSTLLHVPERIQAICWIQFWSWIGWFPFLFYGSTWVGEIYLRYEAPPKTSQSSEALDEVGRHGSMALIVYSIVGTLASVVIPWFIRNPDEDETSSYTARPPRRLEKVLTGVTLQKPSLLAAWKYGNLLFASAMIWAPMVQSVRLATLLVAFLGIPNAIGGMAPGTFLGVEVNRMSNSLPSSRSRSPSHRRMSTEESVELGSNGELSGIYLGILNIYTTLPQFVGTGISMVVFSILEPGKSPELAKDAKPDEQNSKDGLSGIGVCLFIGALSAVGAAYATRRLKNAY